MKWLWVVAVALFVAVAVVAPVRGQTDGTFRCGVPDVVVPDSLPPDSLAAWLENLTAGVTMMAETDTVNARIVFMGFPGGADSLTLPFWADSMAATLQAFIATMSHGEQQLNVSVLRRPGAPDSAWVAPYPAHIYVTTYGALAYEYCNQDVFKIVGETDSTLWAGVDVVFSVQYQCLFPCDNTTSDWTCEETCNWGGINNLMAFIPTVDWLRIPGYTRNTPGTTQRVFYWPCLNTPTAKAAGAWVAAHEYGHVLGCRWHTPGSEPPDTSSVYYNNPGHYDVMRAIASPSVVAGGLTPYSPWALNTLVQEAGRAGWMRRIRIEADTVGLRIPELWSEDGYVAEVMLTQQPRSSTRGYEFMWLTNYQGNNAFDAKYGGQGLLAWHGTRVGGWSESSWYMNVFDLESALGKFTGGAADPVSGRDALEADKTFVGSGDDFWGRSGKDWFTATSNPNTNVYARAQYTLPHAPQDSATSVAFENIRRDSITGDMIVDVFLTPKQFVTWPNGGEQLSEGAADTIRWAVRPYANIISVDLYVKPDSSAAYVLISSGQANSGAFVWTPSGTGTHFRVKVVSHDAAGGVGEDESDQEFSVQDVVPPAAVSDLSVDGYGRHTLTVVWTAPGDDSLAGTAAEYDLRYSTSPITEGNFEAAARAATPDPSEAGTPECVELWELGSCHSYYCALKTRDEAGNWSAMSNAASGATLCSGYQEVLCGGDGLLVQGGSGGGWLLEGSVLGQDAEERAAAVADAVSSEAEAATVRVYEPNEVSDASDLMAGTTVETDTCALEVPAAADSGRIAVRLSPKGQSAWELSGVRVLGVDRGVEERVALAGESALVGTLRALDAVTDSSGSDLAAALASGQEAVTVQVGSRWDMSVSGVGAGGAALFLEVVGRGAEDGDDARGITILAEDGAGGWRALTTLVPRDGENRLVVDSLPGGHLRLLFHDEYTVERLAWLGSCRRVSPQELDLVRAEHSEAGSVLPPDDGEADLDATIGPGENLVLTYDVPAVQPDQARDFFLVVRGRQGESERPAVALSAAATARAAVLPVSFALHQNQPNPFSGTTTVRFDLPVASRVEVTIFDLQGRRVRTLASGDFAAGFQAVVWDQRGDAGDSMRPGIYLCQLAAGTFRTQRTMVLLP